MSPATNVDIGRFLEELARRKTTTTYGELAERFGFPPMEGAWSAHPLSQVFDSLDQQDAAASRPFRTSVVIRRDRNIPGDGYFESLARVKTNGISAKTDRAKEKVWLDELKAAYAFRWPKA
ncbi:MAG TPA: hypothetical protein VN929_00700 [Burkholderiales bacterium]|nr:hypothetical protein [Burkholderiales bacterium]